MQRLRQLREAAGYSQQRLAEMLKTTQQTIGRWEAGKAEPNLSALRDLALLFGTSVDDLLSLRGHRKPPSIHSHFFTGKEQDGFWGHVGLKLGDLPSRWFPVTASSAAGVRDALVNLEDDNGWIGFETLANRFVAFRPAATRKTWLLDDDCDGPNDDWELDLPYQGLPLEVYRAFERLHDSSISSEQWEAVIASMPHIGSNGMKCAGNREVWADYLAKMSAHFNGEVSQSFLAYAASEFVDRKFHDENRYYRYMHHTEVHFVDGTSEAFWVDPADLSEFAIEIDAEPVPTIVRLQHEGGEAESYYPASRLIAVIMPLIGLLDAQKDADESDRGLHRRPSNPHRPD
jgi:transcriptional regulator with XRE-family HTH domain